jgi:pilus assembly protein CpaE
MEILGRGKLQIGVMVRSPELGKELVTAIGPNDDTKLYVRVGALKEVGAKIAKNDKPDVLIVDVDPDDADDMAALRELAQLGNGTSLPLVATAQSISPLMLRRLLRDGIDDFIPQPLNGSEVWDALRTAIAKHNRVAHQEKAAGGSVISFLRASGGMGATTLAINTAFVLAQASGGSAPRVCLLDLDPQFGNAALSLDVAHGHGMVDIVRSPTRLDGELLRGAMLRHRSGVYVLTAPNVPMPLDALRPEVVEQIIEVAQREFDYVIIDLPHALTHWTETVLVRSALLALVVQLTVPALRQARRLIDMLQEEGHYALPIAVVLNRYTHRWNDILGVKDVEKALERKVDHVIANDFELVCRALNEGLPATAINRRSKFSRNITELVEAAVARMHAVPVSALAG